MNDATRQLLERHFDTAFSAPDGIAKLRELILTLAMQGKLVEQDPTDQPASELLKEIEAEKQRLVKAGKIKAPKPLPPIKPEEVPYELPRGWQWVRLGDVVSFEYGDSLPSNQRSNSGEFPVYGSNGVVGTHNEAFVNKACIVIGRKGSAGALNLCLTEGCCVTDVAYYCIPPEEIELNFCFLLFRTLRLDALGKGIKPGLNRNEAYGLVIAVPPYAEQIRIVASIQQLMVRCDGLEKLRKARDEQRLAAHAAAIKKLLETQDGSAWNFIQRHFSEMYSVKENIAELRKAILQLAVMGRLVHQEPNDPPASELLKEIEAEKQRLVKTGKIKKPQPLPPINSDEVPYELPKGWEWVRLGEISITSDSGWSPQCLPVQRSAGQWGVLKVSAVSWGKYDPNQNKALPLEKTPRLECEVKVGDFLISRANTDELVARSVVVEDASEKLMMSDKIVRFSLFNSISKHFVNFANGADFSRTYYISNASGTSSSMKNVSRRVMEELPIPFPPVAEQRRIVAKIDHLMNLCDSLEQQIDIEKAKSSELLGALLNAKQQEQSNVTDLSTYRSVIGCYAFGKLANTQYFGRTAAAKIMYLAQAHVGLPLDLHPEREAAGPLDKWIYDFDREGQRRGWFEIKEKTLANGWKKTEYRCLPALLDSAAKADVLMSAEQRTEFDRMIYSLADKLTEEVEVIATLFAVWNDFLIDGIQPTDEQIISEVRENWHERKARFSPSELRLWLDWLRDKKLIPQGLPPRTVQQPRLIFD